MFEQKNEYNHCPGDWLVKLAFQLMENKSAGGKDLQ